MQAKSSRQNLAQKLSTENGCNACVKINDHVELSAQASPKRWKLETLDNERTSRIRRYIVQSAFEKIAAQMINTYGNAFRNEARAFILHLREGTGTPNAHECPPFLRSTRPSIWKLAPDQKSKELRCCGRYSDKELPAKPARQSLQLGGLPASSAI